MSKFSMLEMEELKSLADKHCSSEMVPCTYLYRNKSIEYFDAITRRNGGIMETELKDSGGSPKNPINGTLRGVLFTANADRRSADGDSTPPSPHGSSSFRVYIEHLIKPNSIHKLYFADFYCVGNGNHYVLLVVCRVGSKADLFCENHLPELYWDENHFLNSSDGVTFKIVMKEHCIIDVFYAEAVNVKKLLDSRAAFLESGFHKPENGYSIYEGLKKNQHCQICNVQKIAVHIVIPSYYNNVNNNNSPQPCTEQSNGASTLAIEPCETDPHGIVDSNPERNSLDPRTDLPQLTDALQCNITNAQMDFCNSGNGDTTQVDDSPKSFLTKVKSFRPTCKVM